MVLFIGSFSFVYVLFGSTDRVSFFLSAQNVSCRMVCFSFTTNNNNNNNNLIYIAPACQMTSEALADSSSRATKCICITAPFEDSYTILSKHHL